MKAQRDRQPVELGFGTVFDRSLTDPQPRSHAAVKGHDVLVIESVIEREHRHAVAYLREAGRDLAADALRRGIRAAQFGVRVF